MQGIRLISSTLLAAALLAGCQHTAPRQQAAEAQSRAAQGATTQPAAAQQAATQPAATPQARVDFRLAQTEAAPGLAEVKLPDGSIWVLPQPVLTRADLASVGPHRTEQGQPYVRFGFSQEGARKLAAIAQRYPDKLLLLSLNDALVAAPQIQGSHADGALNVRFASEQQALDVTRRIVK